MLNFLNVCRVCRHSQVYSGPSGRFKPHVDTPRSPSQFGSLVVCLPVEHAGGQLNVRHKNEEITFDWASKRDDPGHASIHWAAFYSDCEHEVLEVTGGHRLTLTYNLYTVRGAGRLTGVSPTLDTAHLPLFHAIGATIARDPFDGQGEREFTQIAALGRLNVDPFRFLSCPLTF